MESQYVCLCFLVLWFSIVCVCVLFLLFNTIIVCPLLLQQSSLLCEYNRYYLSILFVYFCCYQFGTKSYLYSHTHILVILCRYFCWVITWEWDSLVSMDKHLPKVTVQFTLLFGIIQEFLVFHMLFLCLFCSSHSHVFVPPCGFLINLFIFAVLGLHCCAWASPSYNKQRLLMDRGAWQATVHGIANSQTRLKRLSTNKALRGFPMSFLRVYCLSFLLTPNLLNWCGADVK